MVRSWASEEEKCFLFDRVSGVMTGVTSGAAAISQPKEAKLPGATRNLERNQLGRIQVQKMGPGAALSPWSELCLKLVAMYFSIT